MVNKMAEQTQLFDTQALFSPAETRRACEVIYEQIKEKILNGELKPGDKLPSERAMMDMLGRSRPSVREALRMLERSGFIRIVPGSRGAMILEPNTAGVEQSMSNLVRSKRITTQEMAEYRRVNDVLVSEWAAKRRTKADIVAMQELLDKAEQALDDYRQFVVFDPQFHYLIAQAAKNEVACIVTQVLSTCMQESLTLRIEQLAAQERRGVCEKILRLHRAMAQAIADGDVERARETTGQHVGDMHRDFSVAEEEND